MFRVRDGSETSVRGEGGADGRVGSLTVPGAVPSLPLYGDPAAGTCKGATAQVGGIQRRRHRCVILLFLRRAFVTLILSAAATVAFLRGGQ